MLARVLVPQLLVIAQIIAACEHRAFQQMPFVRSGSPTLRGFEFPANPSTSSLVCTFSGGSDG